MRFAHLTPIVPLAVLLTLAGCASFSDSDSSSNSSANSSSATTSTSSTSSSERRASSSSDSSRDDRGGSSSSRDTRSASGDAGKGDLVTQLNEASRELAALRAANAKLRAEKSSAPAPSASSSSSAARSTPADDKLNQTLRSYAQFRQELSAIVADLEKLRADNATLTSQLKEASAKAQQASSAAAKLERELSAERDARVDAEKTIASLREQLRAVAKAVKEAGVPLDPAARSGR